MKNSLKKLQSSNDFQPMGFTFSVICKQDFKEKVC